MQHIDFKLGARFRRVFIAFLISNLVAVVQVWLGMEYSKLSRDLDELGSHDGSSSASQASAFFKKASRLTFALFACGIAFMVFAYWVLYSFMWYVITTAPSSLLASSPASLFTSLLSLLAGVPVFMIVNAILSCAANIILRKGWNSILALFNTREDLSSLMPIATKQVTRVIKGVNRSVVSSELSIVSWALLIPGFIFMYELVEGTLIAHVVPSALIPILAFTIMLLVGEVLLLVGSIFGLIGMINQAIGVFDLSKALNGGEMPPSNDVGSTENGMS